MNMKRRSFIRAGLVGITATVACSAYFDSDEETIAMVVRRRLDYLKLDAVGLVNFSKDMAGINALSKSKMLMLSMIKPVYTRFSLSEGDNQLSDLLRHGEDRIVSTYLISSDFFLNGADESRVVSYLGMLDPLRACGNPFAQSPL